MTPLVPGDMLKSVISLPMPGLKMVLRLLIFFMPRCAAKDKGISFIMALQRVTALCLGEYSNVYTGSGYSFNHIAARLAK